MKLVEDLYTVYNGEKITIEISPSVSLGAGQFVAERDGSAQDPLVFIVTKNVGQQHDVSVTYVFAQNVPSGSEYKIKINGDADDNEGPFRRKVTTNSPVQPTPERSYLFRVVAKQ